MFENQPKGLYALALANTGERFGYYTMLATFVLFLKANFGFSAGTAGSIYAAFLALVYFLPFIGGILADKFGYGRMVKIGVMIMFAGYVVLAMPLGANVIAIIGMAAALLMISAGTGLFKGNLQVMVGNLYDDPRYSSQRDSAFSIFYMAINIGALFAPSAAVGIMKWAQNNLGVGVNDSYHFAFGVACISLIVSILIYYGFRSTFKHVEGNGTVRTSEAKDEVVELSPKETKDRITALILVFAVVVFFWMAFHQNGLTLTLFADEFTVKSTTGVESMFFDVFNLVLAIVMVYGLFGLFQSKTSRGKGIAGAIVALAAAGLAWKYAHISGSTEIDAPIFQQFNPFFVVALTPVSMALFGWLGRVGKEPSAPRKIAYGMLVAAIGFMIMTVGSVGLPSPAMQAANGATPETLVSSNWLISTYLVLTFGELLLSPMGISFVSKVAPPKYKGMMMGGWFVATAIGNYLTSIPALLWGDAPLYVVWGLLIVLCLLAFIFMLAIMKKLEKVC
ncbi:amino acid/peptide transporter [Prevotella sp. DNF00663]|uniref:peptide MFS transporter n=1 Tax=Prevotella sp. DNF00663 TaxID=1384078 RepID=UPI000781F079|nr:peptide MFS transporter [Prevotella sp. DNF00663]KXB82220.1 amino acid/peptide transporter [Prevotella sp. DNF00663]